MYDSEFFARDLKRVNYPTVVFSPYTDISLVPVKLASTDDFFRPATTQDSLPSASPISDSGEHSPFANGSMTKPGDTVLDRNPCALLFRDSRLSSERPRNAGLEIDKVAQCVCRADTEIEIQEIHVRNWRFDQHESYDTVQSLFGQTNSKPVLINLNHSVALVAILNSKDK